MQRKKKSTSHRRAHFRLATVLLSVFMSATFAICRYVDTCWKPTLYELAEYEARAAVTAALNEAVSKAMSESPQLYQNIYRAGQTEVQLDVAAANRARAALTAAATAAVESLPETDRVIPFGSLTENSLLGGLGPGWHLNFRPQGYVQAKLCQKAEIIGVNTTHYAAWVQLETVVNMILNSYQTAVTVSVEVPLADLVICCDTPTVYARG